jgi:NAD(P)-dependent dehydrogenase (short-subunit alcohol dehydrogenase family)
MPSDRTATATAPDPGVARPALGTVIVTGGASGLGRAVAAAVAEHGGTPVILDRAAPQGGHEHEAVDLADTAAAEAAVHRVAERHGDLRGIVTAAGTDACGRLVDVERDTWERVIAVNLLGTAAIVRAALPHLEQTQGRVVTIASTLGWRALSDATAYCASKFGVVGFTRALMAEVGDRVGVTLLLPGGMQTHFFDDRPEQYRPGADAVLAPPEEIAAAALFALTRPPGVDVREMMVSVSTEPSWP